MGDRIEQKNNTTESGDIISGNKLTKNYFGKSSNTRLKRLFETLYNEVEKDEKLQDVCEELNRYLTDKDTIGLEQKLTDGGYGESYIIDALEQKEFFAKKLYSFYEYESAQFIYVDLLALIKTNFQDYIYPLIELNTDKNIISSTIREKIINPIIEILNTDGAADSVLNLNAEEVRGMIYYLTGRCHIKWSNDSI